MNVHLVNPDDKYGRIALQAPTTRGYIHVAAQTCEPSFPFRANTDTALLEELKELAAPLQAHSQVERVSVFRAVGLPPMDRLPYVRDHADSIRIARYDIALLIETTDASALAEVQSTPLYEAVVAYLQTKSMSLHVMTAVNQKRFGEVDVVRGGLFLFNYFVAKNRETLLELWEYLADWYRVEMKLDNSLLLVPTHPETSDYTALNHARFDGNLSGFLAKQLSKKSFRTYMLANLAAHHIGAMPILYRVV
ncbi:hypothetical protein JI721_02785 [Alicyclobacillus cycloheptanicus]|uniref:Uncharacterized protein n=1 Tax=Alicyclobacillus cycloheptanicus TaxID=1457 RepID=A0ABT9XMI1_9BACL|nr:hypothetical protein [Alicyclobacillus cycloheptanicus]MDQ0190906.1 hypothetical protein [Alicyclobacillus cycloheptanicus]WDM01791.1 hypothetical protein JI721_02785 [Alicyclobacillus cycloheptanicus]